MSLISWSELSGDEARKCRTLAKLGGELREKLGEYAASVKAKDKSAGLVKAVVTHEDACARNAGCEPNMPRKALALAAMKGLGIGVVETLTYAQAKPFLKFVRLSATGLKASLAKEVIEVCGSEAAAKDEIKALVQRIRAEEVLGDAIGEEVKRLMGEGKALTFWQQAAKKLTGENSEAHAAELVNALGLDADAILQAIADLASQGAQSRELVAA